MNRILKLFYLISIMLTASSSLCAGIPELVSLSPNLTEIICKLNRTDSLIGRSSASNYFAPVKNIPVAGNMGAPYIEKILALKPDVVVASGFSDNSYVRILKESGIKCYLLPTDNIKQYFHTVKFLGKLLNADKQAEQEIQRIKSGLRKFENMNKNIPISKRPRVFWEVWDEPLMTAGNKSFINEFIYYAGGRNIASEINRSYFNASLEWILMSDPQVIIAPFISLKKIQELKDKTGWRNVSAVRNNKIYNNLDANLTYILGPNMLDAIKQIRLCIEGKMINLK